MRVLLDHCVPRPFVRLVVGHDVSTAHDQGWETLSNGKLLAQAAASFDVFVTVDRSMAHQQNKGSLPLPVVLLLANDNTIDSLAGLATELLTVLGHRLDSRVYTVPQPPSPG